MNIPLKTFKLIIEYDGSEFHGWQRQKNDRTVQETIERALGRMTRQAVTLIGSGRTDAGVHALGQVASFRCTTTISAQAFRAGLNSLLPEDIVIHACDAAGDDFHARYDVRSKVYQYFIRNHPLPAAVGRRYAWHVARPLGVAAMQAAARALPGTHDFKAFEGAGSPRASTVRTILAAGLETRPAHRLCFHIEGDGFLRFMVRNIVGTLVEIGVGKRDSDDIRRLLADGERHQAGVTAPPRGLFLVEVNY